MESVRSRGGDDRVARGHGYQETAKWAGNAARALGNGLFRGAEIPQIEPPGGRPSPADQEFSRALPESAGDRLMERIAARHESGRAERLRRFAALAPALRELCAASVYGFLLARGFPAEAAFGLPWNSSRDAVAPTSLGSRIVIDLLTGADAEHATGTGLGLGDQLLLAALGAGGFAIEVGESGPFARQLGDVGRQHRVLEWLTRVEAGEFPDQAPPAFLAQSVMRGIRRRAIRLVAGARPPSESLPRILAMANSLKKLPGTWSGDPSSCDPGAWILRAASILLLHVRTVAEDQEVLTDLHRLAGEYVQDPEYSDWASQLVQEIEQRVEAAGLSSAASGLEEG